MIPFPKWQYTADKIPLHYGDLVRDGLIGRIFHNAEQLATVRANWYDTPAEVTAAQRIDIRPPVQDAQNIEIEKDAPMDERTFLIQKLKAAGIPHHHKWAIDKLKGALNDSGN